MFGRGTWLRTNCTIFTDGSYKKVSTYDEINSLLGEEPKPKQFYIEKGSLSSSDLAALKKLLKHKFKLCNSSLALDADWWEITSYNIHGVTEHKYIGTTNFSGNDTTINAIGRIIPQGKLDGVRPDQRLAQVLLDTINKTKQ